MERENEKVVRGICTTYQAYREGVSAFTRKKSVQCDSNQKDDSRSPISGSSTPPRVRKTSMALKAARCDGLFMDVQSLYLGTYDWENDEIVGQQSSPYFFRGFNDTGSPRFHRESPVETSVFEGLARR